MGFYPAEYDERICPFFESLRGREDLQRAVARARQRAAEFRAQELVRPAPKG